MADIHQWRRRIQPGFPHALMPVGEQDETEPTITSGFGSTHKKVRPKISSYFSHRCLSTGNARSSIWSADQRTSLKDTISEPCPTWLEGCEPDVDQIMDSMMRTLMAEPYRSLDIKYNSPLLGIFEGFRNLRDENASLSRKLKYEVETRFASHHDLDLERQRWQLEREEYKAEVKRLELIIFRDSEGVAGVMRARQGSLLRREHRRRTASGTNTDRDDPRETVFEFLERTRVEDRGKEEAARKAQRVPLRNRTVSPSQKMTLLSHKLSTTCHYSDFDSPPSPHDFTSLSQASMFEILAGRPSLSDTDSSESYSAYQRYAEMVDDQDAASASNDDQLLSQQHAGIENDSLPSDDLSFRKTSLDADSTRPESLHLEQTRRFSFEYDDDDSRCTQVKTQHAASSPLQRCVSVDHRARQRPSLSSLQAPDTLATERILPSPVLTPVVEFPSLSKIPSPSSVSSLARPRREDSSSSFLTAIRCPDGDSNHSRGTSRSSVPLDSPHLSSRESVGGSGDVRRYGSMQDNNTAVASTRTATPSDSPKPST
ncbi:hypothetical protein AUEXF2481DRAFT_6594 [Aureobasidium subglaciale EXF-2481]|uniref:Uncharacterized protein n=1 Tax=Aureobasidium subglaciale (strain EXF-2481) TaxID=1043005 RepID=A0A074YHE9_AURSE|nr:uncharacterized protein AUEXF2481DRAFT_6594 [Aureobasidium subglaciale EXF-2481]KAI5212943.1 hypothetical protein E4T38_00168 [Aureobasidium subglaciale]KAI5232364.1 hypothetical protein E4T40_00167 [Aureobasidium subglaciale]KAI5234714.1 hypothetical protein E4T41_00167 [Aureobasidium subglaciale]KAI5268471.1 hypothetical protein E4T46_00167 [Aureobasidium subglaciale]KEQ93517.1 hypothetical protein AUEXF2481DRAFT_6594 [Aureobasidium subglaciale EXF-2481]